MGHCISLEIQCGYLISNKVKKKGAPLLGLSKSIYYILRFNLSKCLFWKGKIDLKFSVKMYLYVLAFDI